MSGLLNVTRNFTSVKSEPLSGSFITIFVGKIFQDFESKLFFLNEITFPFLYLPFFNPYGILIFIYFIIASGANYNPYYSITTQYVFLIMGIVIIGAITTLKAQKYTNVRRKVISLMIIGAILAFLLYSPFQVANLESGSLSQKLTVTTADSEMNFVISTIPANSSVFMDGAPFLGLFKCSNIFMPGDYNNQTVNYVVLNPEGSVPYWYHFFSTNESYGLYAYVQGISVFELGFHSSAEYYYA